MAQNWFLVSEAAIEHLRGHKLSGVALCPGRELRPRGSTDETPQAADPTHSPWRIELANAIYLRLFRKELVPSKVKAAHALFTQDVEDGIFEPTFFSAAVYERAKLIVRKHTPVLGTRTLDILHVASALVLQADAFYTFDRNQGNLARAEGLAVS